MPPTRPYSTSLVLAALLASPLSAQSDTTAARTLASGVEYRHVAERGAAGARLDMHVVRVDLRRGDIELRVARARDSLRGRERPTDMVRRAARDGTRVLVAVNADFFELASGENENNQVLAGEWWKGLKVTDSPYDSWDNTHSQLAVDEAGHPYLDRFLFDGRAIAHGTATPIITLNAAPTGQVEGTALYTARYGRATPRDTTRRTVEAALVAAGRRGDTLVLVRRGAVSEVSGSAIPAGGAVLAAYGRGLRAAELRAMADGDTVAIVLATLPRLPRRAATIVGGWPRILRNGEDVTGEAPVLEGTISRNAELRHPRTAVGFSRDSTTLVLLTVDGRGESEGGMTLRELAAHMRALGAWEALNLDGGGSTTMVIDGALVNHPSDATGERAVGNALLVVKKR